MELSEWPLALFTVITQMAVGAFVTLGVVVVLASRRYSDQEVDRLATPALFALGPLMVLSMLMTVFHLGNPLNAPNAILHWQSSWLSREIWFVAGFTGLGFVFFVLQWRRWFTVRIRTAFAVFTAVFGLVFVWVMSHVYMIVTIPAWNSWTTVAQFYATTMILGPLCIGLALSAYQTLDLVPAAKQLLLPVGGPLSESKFLDRLPRRLVPWVQRVLLPADAGHESVDGERVSELVARALRWIGYVAGLALVFQLIVSIFILARPKSVNPPVIEFSLPLFWFQMLLIILGAGVAALIFSNRAGMIAAYEKTRSKARAVARLTYLVATAWFVCFAGQLIWRFMFYGMMDRIGI